MSEWNAHWDDWTSILAREIDALPWGWFLIVDYAPVRACAIGPYAQMSRYPQGFYCEAVGESYLPAEEWELDPEALHADGWNPPDPTTDNWWYIADTVDEAAQVMMRSLVIARGCDDPELVTLTRGQHPDPPGDGEPVPGKVIWLVDRVAA
jgi:hypothetical protein